MHSSLLESNPQAAIVTFDSSAPEGQGDGVYFETKVEELEDEIEIRHAMEILNRRVTKEEFRAKRIDEVTGKSTWRIYKAVPIKVSTLTDGEFINGQHVDKRVEVRLLENS